jgi:cupin fold WbuC family metalloprotein
MIKITDQRIEDLAGRAGEMPRKRAHHFFPGDPGDGIQPFLLALDPEAYFRPHRHSDSGGLEVVAALRGKTLVAVFDDGGRVTEHAVLAPDGETRIVEIEAEEWHTVLALQAGSVVLNVKEGPYDPETNKTFAAWAPAEGTPEARAFNRRLLRVLQPGG